MTTTDPMAALAARQVRADNALACAKELTDEIDEGTKTLRRQRAECWKAAHDNGYTWKAIAEACGVSPNLPPYDVARLEGKPWVWTEPL